MFTSFWSKEDRTSQIITELNSISGSLIRMSMTDKSDNSPLIIFSHINKFLKPEAHPWQDLAKHMKALIKLRQELRFEINSMVDSIYHLDLTDDQKKQFATFSLPKCNSEQEILQVKMLKLIDGYLFLQKIFISVVQQYLNFTSTMKTQYWLAMSSGNEEGAKLTTVFDYLISLCRFDNSFDDTMRYKSFSYLFQNYHETQGRELLTEIASKIRNYGSEFSLVYYNPKSNSQDEIKPIVRGDTEEERMNNHHNLFATFNNATTPEEQNIIEAMSLKEYNTFLSTQMVAGDASVLEGFQISVPKEDSLSFVHGWDGKKLVCCFLDFAQINLHEFAHAIAYLTGEALDPEHPNVILPSKFAIYNNPEELRNIALSRFSENNLDVDGPQRIGHKAIYIANRQDFKLLLLHEYSDSIKGYLDEMKQDSDAFTYLSELKILAKSKRITL